MEKMVVISGGESGGGGASRLTSDITQIIAQLPPVLESLTGVKFDQLLKLVPALRNAMEEPKRDGHTVTPPPEVILRNS